ncbi:MAG: SCO family protein [Sphingomonadales bacterium]|jgi:protein SCO1/2
MKNRSLVIGLWVVALAALGGFIGYKMRGGEPAAISAGVVERPVEESTITIGGPFEMVNHRGERVTQEDFKGVYTLIFFGYTFCPDICPFELATMSQALDILEEQGHSLDKIQPVFVSVDPERDDVEALAAYMPAFHPKFIGLTGSVDQVKTMMRAYNIYASKAQSDASADYLMNHSSLIYLMGPDGNFIRYFPPKRPPEELAAGLAEFLQ